MEPTREMSALFHLIDDPDTEVYSTVSERIVSFGKDIIPNLENLWENTVEEDVQERIEMLIHRLHFQDLQQEFTHWSLRDFPELLEGALLVSKYKFPDIHISPINGEIEKLRRNIWLELNSYLTPLEQINVVNKVLFSHNKYKGVEISYQNQEEFLLNKVVETKRGNAIANGILYQAVCQMLDVPVKAINIPRQFILAYFDNSSDYFNTNPKPNKILFYLDPVSGQVYTQKDVENYFKRISVTSSPSYFKPMSNRKIIQFLLNEYSKCFDDDKNRYKQNEVLSLSEILIEQK
ncbi:transglutaminase-like domain-containing protein [Pollutibacter soli]|uniref:transglutaminase-like domain-containing protein n=1 Tax=Pollutibacter soli TaxID=3034157 RepID=UPI0030137745